MTQEPSSSTERKQNRLYTQQVPTLKEKHHRSQCLRNCLRFCLKKRRDMEQRGDTPDPQRDRPAEGGVRELITAWFIQSQAPVISHNGLFPNWFLGFISRKDAEDILMNRGVGCFLVRLSDKALGYILSYKGRERCRHFVINLSKSGQFVIHGDYVGHATVSDLIQYFKERPIQPFGEYLTTSCYAVQNEDLYDTIQVSPKERSVVTIHTQKAKKQMSNQGSERLRQNRGKNMASEEVPPLPRRHLENGTTTENQNSVCYAQVRRKKAKDGEGGAPSRPQSLYAEVDVLDTRCRSLPLLLSSGDEQNYRLSVTPPRPGRDTPIPEPSHALDQYSLATRPCPDPRTRAEGGGVYAEVPATHRPLVDDTYEQLPDKSSPYEPVGPMRAKHGPSSWGIKNDKWKWLFPEVKRKW